jgi:hypothetical protein
MIAQMRPDIARITEETVLNLKELETRIDAVKNDLAWLCQSIGHSEAARVAASPTPGQLQLLASSSPLWAGAANPFAGQAIGGYSSPFGLSTYGPAAVTPFATPFASPFASPFAQSPYAGSPLLAAGLQGSLAQQAAGYGAPLASAWTHAQHAGYPSFASAGPATAYNASFPLPLVQSNIR